MAGSEISESDVRAALQAAVEQAEKTNAASAGAVPYHEVPEQSRMRFSAKSALGTTTGEFQDFTIVARINPDDITGSEIHISIVTPSASPDGILPGFLLRKRLKTSHYPQARVDTLSIKKLGPRQYEAELHVVFQGDSYTMNAPLVVSPEGDRLRIDGICKLDPKHGLDGQVEFSFLLEPDNQSTLATRESR